MPVVVDTSVYLAVLRDEGFARTFRDRYATDIPQTGFLNDVLIALSERSIGARVLTRNGEDFLLVHSLRAFSLEVV